MIDLACITMSLLLAGPPIESSGPLERVSPRRHEVTWRVTLQGRGRLEIPRGELRFPLVPLSCSSRIDSSSVSLLVNVDAKPPIRVDPVPIEHDRPLGDVTAVVDLGGLRAGGATFTLSYQADSYATRFDDRAAARIAWPRDWPEEVRPALEPQEGIESSDEVFAATVARVSEGRLRMVPPLLAAKDLVRHCVLEFRWEYEPVTEPAYGKRGFERRHRKVRDHRGALNAARTGHGSPADLVSLCVALLKAAGLPARPVSALASGTEEKSVMLYGEVFLPGAGWIPFDPSALKDAGIMGRNVRDPWPGFGTVDGLERVVPIVHEINPYLDRLAADGALGVALVAESAPEILVRLDVQLTGRGLPPR